MDSRYKAPNKSIYNFYNKIYVFCPRCNLRATISKNNNEGIEFRNRDILICSECGYIKENPRLHIGQQLKLWLQVSCCGHILWALNEEHLDYLENHVRVMLRERVQDDLGWHNQSVSSRLPK